jgi:hypothetical protein
LNVERTGFTTEEELMKADLLKEITSTQQKVEEKWVDHTKDGQINYSLPNGLPNR